MEIKKGYKISELGIIPEDWQIKLFGDVMTGFTSGATPYRGKPEFFKGDIRWITSGELSFNNITDTLEKITPDAVKKTNLKIHPVGTFLIAITGLEAAGTRGRCGFVGMPSATNQSCMALFPKEEQLDNDYLYHYYVWQGNNLALKFCQGTKQQSYTASIAKILPIICPPLKEQQAITEILSDIDNLIKSLEKEISKKRLIKQGLMQKLLTPKTDWKIKRLGDLAEMYSGGTPLTSNSKYYNGNIPWVIIADITKAGKYISETEKTISSEGLSNSSAKLFKKGVLLFAMYASIGKTTIALMDTACNQAILGIQSKLIETEYLYYLLSYRVKEFIKMGQIGTQSNLSKDLVQKIEIPIPPEDKRKEIICILSDIDYELELIGRKLIKYNLFKQGIMQHLLSGKLRIIQHETI